jgi:TonB family protein
MRLLSLFAIFSQATVVCLFTTVANAQTQGVANTAPGTGVVLTQLSPPIYPPLARQARIMGDVKIQVGIRQDGSVASAEVISGHPMLKQAALESAQKSAFECRRCGEAVTSFPMTYTFGFYEDGGGCGFKIVRVRSSRCLYLWKCGEEWHEPDYRAPAITQSQGHITILVSTACVETEAETVH